MLQSTPIFNQLVQERATALGSVRSVDNSTYAFISALETTDGQPLSGNVLRRTCMAFGEEACKSVCVRAVLGHRAPVADLSPSGRDAYDAARDDLSLDTGAECSDDNLSTTLERLHINPDQALVVSVGANDSIGFYDESLSELKKAQGGWYEVSGFNAYFMRNNEALNDGAGEIALLGARLADSGFLVVTLKDHVGGGVTGIIHSTRTNMLGKNHRKEWNGKECSYIEHVLAKAIDHYGADPANVMVSLAAAVGPMSWKKKYASAQALEQNLPGWAEDGLIINRTNPEWRPGMEVVNPNTEERDELWPLYPSLIIRDMVEAAGNLSIPLDNVVIKDPVDPGVINEGKMHSSKNRTRFARPGESTNDTRDLYAAIIKR